MTTTVMDMYIVRIYVCIYAYICIYCIYMFIYKNTYILNSIYVHIFYAMYVCINIYMKNASLCFYYI